MIGSKPEEPKSFQGVERRTLRRFGLLQSVLEKHEDYGVVRIFRKSLREVEALRSALPTEYFDIDWVDSDAQGDSQGGRYFILWIKTRIDNLPPLAQTIIFILKEV